MTDTTAAPTEPVALRIEIDRKKITLGDLRFISKMQGDKNSDPAPMERMFDMLERVIVGGIEDIPYDALPAVVNALSSALSQENEIKN